MKNMSARDFSRVADHIEQARAILKTAVSTLSLEAWASKWELEHVDERLDSAWMGLEGACIEQQQADLESLRADACKRCGALPPEQDPTGPHPSPEDHRCDECGAEDVTTTAMAYTGPEEPDIDF